MSLTCPKCGAMLQPDSIFCEVCGERVMAEECPSCGAPVESGSLYCSSCRSSLMRCNSCNALNQTDSLFCVSCGKPIAQSSSQSQQQTRSRHDTSVHTHHRGDNDDDPTMLKKMITITENEARYGCRKNVRLKSGEFVDVTVPPHTNPATLVEVPGYGLPDGWGGRGKLVVSFFIVP